MEALTVRLLPDEIDDGPHHMAADEVLLRQAAGGVASLRFYTWSRPTLSLGYFQPAAGRLDDPLLVELPFVRRPTGGHALVHDRELTYCLAIPAISPWKSGACWLRMHEVIALALADHGVRTGPCATGDASDSGHFLCFHHHTPGDLMIGLSKIAGSAQRKQRGAVMQHGSVLLEHPRFTRSLLGIRDLTHNAIEPAVLAASIVRHVEDELGWQMLRDGWTEKERQAIEELAESRYRCDAWNRKR